MNIQETIAQKFGNPLEWNSAKKASLLLWTYFFDQLLYQLFIELGMTLPALVPWVDQSQAALHRTYFSYLLLTSLGLLAITHLTQNRYQHCVIFEYIACLYFGLSHVYYGYCIGLMSLPVGVVMVGAPVVGFIFSHRWAVATAFVSSMVVIALLTMATMSNKLSYAPLAVGLYQADGQMQPLWVLAYAVFALPHVLFIFGLAYYVLNRWRYREEEATRLSRTDGLTGLINRRHIMGLLEFEKARCESRKTPLSVVMVDLDYFKSINDRWGHDVGDQVLVEAARTLKQSVRQSDHVGRYGGEEFLVILPGLDAELAKSLAERIRTNIASVKLELPQGESCSISASLGMSCYSTNVNLELEYLVKQADVALYAAKDGGRDQLVVAMF